MQILVVILLLALVVQTIRLSITKKLYARKCEELAKRGIVTDDEFERMETHASNIMQHKH